MENHMSLQKLDKLSFEDAERVLQFQKLHGMGFGEAAQYLGLVGDVGVDHGSGVRPVPAASPVDYPSLPKGQGHYPPELVAAYQPFSDVVKMLRTVHGELMLRWLSRERKALVIASVDQAEGTSFIAANLAVVFSQLGSNTLLIDANLRRPRQHQIFNLANTLGLSEVLGGHAGVETIARISDFKDLSVMPAGTISHATHTLVSRTNFGTMREKFAARFGVTIIDAPPFSDDKEAMAIAACVGGVLLVGRKHKTRLADISAVRAQLARIDAEVVGSVLLEF
jgi:protein-tyrosine kinase